MGFYSFIIFIKTAKKWSFQVSFAINHRTVGTVLGIVFYLIVGGQENPTLCMPVTEQSLDFHPGIIMDSHKKCLVPLVARMDATLGIHVDEKTGEDGCLLITDFDKFEQLCNSLYSSEAKELDLYRKKELDVQQVWVSCLEVWDTMSEEELANYPFSDFNKKTINDIQAKNYSHVKSLRSIRLAVEHVANSGRSAIAVEGEGVIELFFLWCHGTVSIRTLLMLEIQLIGRFLKSVIGF